MIQIAPVAVTQKDELFELLKFLTPPGSPETPAFDREKFGHVFDLMSQNPHYHLLGALDEKQKLLGSVMGLLSYDLKLTCRPLMFMENMVVMPEARSKGTGKKLLLALEEIARRENCFFIQFCSSMSRKDAHRFYEEKMGYHPETAKGYRKFL